MANAKACRRLEATIGGIRIEVGKDPTAHACVTYVPALGNMSTFGATLEETLDMLLTYIVSMDDDGLPLPFSKAEIKRFHRVF